jgi:hypothetical protein
VSGSFPSLVYLEGFIGGMCIENTIIGTYVFPSGSRFFGYSHSSITHIILIPNGSDLYTLRNSVEGWFILGRFVTNNN